MKYLNVDKLNYTIQEYLQKYGLKVIEVDFHESETDALVINKHIAIKKNFAVGYKFYLVLHEIGHIILHAKEFESTVYYHKQHKTLVEQQADSFACDVILRCCEVSPTTMNISDLLIDCGIPGEVANNYYLLGLKLDN